MRIVYAVAGLWLLLGTGYAAWFLLHDYASLRDFYLGLGPLYRWPYWTTDFFTPITKAAGDRLAWVGLVAGPLALLAVGRAWRGYPLQEDRLRLPLARPDLPYVLVLNGLLLGLWWVGHSRLPPAFDEVFSAVHIAGAGPFVALSYYMLPNNHVLFNVLNALLFGGVDELVLTGRLISLMAYLLLGVLQYGWLRGVLGQQFAAFALTVLLAVVLPVWGFAVQARGYALLLLFSWGAFIAAWRLVRSSGGRGRRMETVLASCCVLGYATVPVFLYVHLSLLVWVGWSWLRRRRVSWGLVGSQAVAGVAIFLFYLPAISFSGLGAIAGNRYVAAAPGQSVPDFAQRIVAALPDYVNYIALDLAAALPYAIPLLALLPLAFLLVSAGPWRELGRFYLVLLVTTLAVTIGMRAMPFHRSIIVQLQFVGLLLALLPVAGWWKGYAGAGVVRGEGAYTRLTSRAYLSIGAYALQGVRTVRGGIALGWLLLAAWLAWRTPQKFSLHLYYYDIVPTYRAVEELIDRIPAGSRIGGADEAFYPLYLVKDRNTTTPEDPITYYLKRPEEDVPLGWELVTEAVGFELWYVGE